MVNYEQNNYYAGLYEYYLHLGASHFFQDDVPLLEPEIQPTLTLSTLSGIMSNYLPAQLTTEGLLQQWQEVLVHLVHSPECCTLAMSCSGVTTLHRVTRSLQLFSPLSHINLQCTYPSRLLKNSVTFYNG